jgi:hypothetical protein
MPLTRPGLVLVVMALVTATLAPLPAAAAVVDTSFTCPADLEAAGFTDIAAHPESTRRAIDCLALHDITRGTTPTTFDPGGTVPRWQMALFLVRQAEAQGVTVPSGADQGFADLAGLSQEARTAVNQLAQLGITLGTGPNTFDPYQPVSRWQMALFITRLLAASGVSVPAAVDQGFGDVAEFPATARTAIDQLAMLGVAEGTSPTTFSPGAHTLRWHMALFLTRALAVAGVLPPGVKPIHVTPAEHAYLDFGGTLVTRHYTANISMSGPVTIELWPAEHILADGRFTAATPGVIGHCDITLADGSATSTDKVTGIEPTGSTLAFTVGCTGTGDEVVPVVYTGSALDGMSEAAALVPVAPTNTAVGFGGGITVVSQAPAGAFGPVTVESVDKATKSFTSGGVTWFWDATDVFKINGVAVTMTEFEAALSSGDAILPGSTYSPDGVSVFDLDDIAPVPPGLSLASVTSTTATLTYVAAAGSDRIEIHSCAGSGCETTLVRSVVNGTDEDPSTPGTQIVVTGLTPTTDYDFQAVQIEDTDASQKSAAVHVYTPVALKIVELEVTDPNDGENHWSGIRLTFDKNVNFNPSVSLDDLQVHRKASPGTVISASSLMEGPETYQVLVLFPNQPDTTPDTEWVLTIEAGALRVGAGGDPNGEIVFEFSH